MRTRSFVLAIGCAALAFGCVGESSETDSSEGDSQEIIDNLVEAGFAVTDIQVVDHKVYVGNDAQVTLQSSREMIKSHPGEEQYRTFNLVGGGAPAIICVNGAGFVNGTLNVGLNLAIENYNQLFVAGISRLVFVRIAGGPIAGCHFFINGIVQGGLVGGSSGFPFSGIPFPQIIIGDGIVPFGLDVAEHVITHELGHCIGLRHSDFFNRAISCGGAPVNEEIPASGLGAVFIPGTLAGAGFGLSLMNSCFSAVETGEFTGTDVAAINFLY